MLKLKKIKLKKAVRRNKIFNDNGLQSYCKCEGIGYDRFMTRDQPFDRINHRTQMANVIVLPF